MNRNVITFIVYQALAEAWSKRGDPARSADYSRISDDWRAEAQRLEPLSLRFGKGGV